MKTLSKLSFALIVGLSLASLVLADAPRDAGSKARGEAYNFWVGRSANNHARDNSRSLYYYGQTQPSVSVPQAQEHVTAVRQNLNTCQKAIGELKKSNPENKEALAAIEKIEVIHKKVLGHCEQMDKQFKDGKGDGTVICACCADMHSDLDAADAEMDKLMKSLKIEKLEPPTKAAKPATPEKK